MTNRIIQVFAMLLMRVAFQKGEFAVRSWASYAGTALLYSC